MRQRGNGMSEQVQRGCVPSIRRPWGMEHNKNAYIYTWRFLSLSTIILRMAVNSLLDQTIQPNVTYDMDGKGRFNAVSDRSIDMRRYKQITCAVMNLSISAGKCGFLGGFRNDFRRKKIYAVSLEISLTSFSRVISGIITTHLIRILAVPASAVSEINNYIMPDYVSLHADSILL